MKNQLFKKKPAPCLLSYDVYKVPFLSVKLFFRFPENPTSHKATKNKVTKCKKKSKAVPLHTMEEHGGRGGIAPTHT
jgi:hypothetical protein